jgi:hypothetical protein
VATIIAASAMAIFSGDIPGALLRIPGAPASAAYTDEAYAMTRKGQPELALGIGVWFSAPGGIAGTLSLMALAPPLAEMALNFSTYEYFWLAFMGLMCATLVARSSPVKAIAAMLLGLLVSCIGMENPAGTPRFTFGITDLLAGIEPIPALVGVFAVSEVMRAMLTPEPPKLPHRRFGSILKGQLALTRQYVAPQVRGNIVGIIIGVLPGAGADMAAWVSYAMSKRFSKEPEKFGTGHPEGLIEAGASNNASLASDWVPSLLFGIPGDTITAIAIGVLYMKGLNPGPTLFTERASAMYALYIIFILANIIMIPLGILMIRLAAQVLRAPRASVMPVQHSALLQPPRCRHPRRHDDRRAPVAGCILADGTGATAGAAWRHRAALGLGCWSTAPTFGHSDMLPIVNLQSPAVPISCMEKRRTRRCGQGQCGAAAATCSRAGVASAGEDMNAPMRCPLQPCLAGMVFVLAGVLTGPAARAEDTCRTRCWDTYGACYKSTSNRERCQGQLLRCLNNCIRAHRRPAAAGSAAPRPAPQRGPDPAHSRSGLSPPGSTPPPSPAH